MKTIAYTALHYGSEYLASAIRAAVNYVDEWHCLYTPHPSHGHNSSAICPDTETDLHEIAWQAAGSKLRWHVGNWHYEGQQRNSIHQYAPDADAILIVDSDEIYSEKLLENVASLIQLTSGYTGYRTLRLPFVHFYRDFRHAVIHDPAYPQRVIFPHVQNTSDATWDAHEGSVAHMGYCQSAETIRYKLSIHGHKSELRCSADAYVDSIYLNEQRWTDLHPVGSEYWNAEVVNPFDYLPYWMADHPNCVKDIVK